MNAKLPKDTRILLVDDEPDFRNILAFSFKKLGYQVLFASNGKEAFELIQKTPIDIVISDIRMPGGDGIELLDRTKEHHIHAPIVLLVTGYSELSSEEAHNKGAEALFSKPLDRNSLQETVQRLLTPLEERWTRASQSVDQELDVELRFEGLPEAIQAKVVNLGRGGMFVALSQRQCPNVNSSVAFKLNFGGSNAPLSGNGVVRWVRTKESKNFSAGCGIEFTYLGDEDRRRVIDFITVSKPKAYIPNQ